MRPDPESLSAVPLFSTLSEDQRERLAGWMDIEVIPAGRQITPEGAAGYVFFVIESGSASVQHDGVTIRTLGPGQFFGELAFLGDGRRTADVVADTEMQVFAMFGTRFREMQAEMPDVADQIQAAQTERLG